MYCLYIVYKESFELNGQKFPALSSPLLILYCKSIQNTFTDGVLFPRPKATQEAVVV